MQKFFTAPLWQFKPIILVIAIAVLFAPQVTPNDHELNVEPLVHLNRVYENPSYIYPPHALTLMLPFVLIGGAGTRVLMIAIVGYFGITRQWSILRYFATILNPVFVYAMMFSNLDLFIILLPVLLFDKSNNIVRGLLLATLMLKPQLGAFLAIYYVIQYGAWRAAVIGGIFTLAHCIFPDANGSPMVLEWIDNIANPTEYNAAAWSFNPVGPRWLLLVLLPLIYYYRRESWTQDHTIAALLILSMTISPYASFQSVLVPLTMLSSVLLAIANWIMVVAGVIGVVWYFLAALILGDTAWRYLFHRIYPPHVKHNGQLNSEGSV